jgi:hypothetical protein
MSRFRFLAARKRTLGSHLPRGGRFVLEPWVDCQYLLVTLGFPSVLAERVGFEPTVRLPVQRFSRPSHSTSLAPLRGAHVAWRSPRGNLSGRERQGKIAHSQPQPLRSGQLTYKLWHLYCAA